MKCLVGIDDTDSSTGYCTTYLGYRIAADLHDDLSVLPYPRLVRLNPNIPFKTRGNAAVCLPIETDDPSRAFEAISAKVAQLSDVANGANSGLVFLDDQSQAPEFKDIYLAALRGLVSVHRVRRRLDEKGVKTMTLGNGMGLVGAACSLAFDEREDHTYELIGYRRYAAWGSKRSVDASSVRQMDLGTFPRTFNNYDYQKKRVLVTPHGPDPVFAGIRGDSPATVLAAFSMLKFEEELEGYMVYLTNQHTDAHVQTEVDWKAYSSGWAEGEVGSLYVGEGSHLYISLNSQDGAHDCAVYEPTGDLRRAAMLLEPGDRVRVSGGVRRPSSAHPIILNAEKLEVLSLAGRNRKLLPGVYISSPRANRHLTKPFARYLGRAAVPEPSDAWFSSDPRRVRALAESPKSGRLRPLSPLTP